MMFNLNFASFFLCRVCPVFVSSIQIQTYAAFFMIRVEYFGTAKVSDVIRVGESKYERSFNCFE